MRTNNISLSSFTRSSDKTRAGLIKKYGIYIESYFNNDQLINIYALKEFFVEVIINIRHNHVVACNPFKKGFSVNTGSR